MNPYTDDVNGTIIGDVTFPYEFWEAEPTWPNKETCRIARGHFKNDEDAIDWFRTNHPIEFANGAEMRCFDIDLY